ncbi:septum formation inhibitor Maf [Wenyingzhuangia sp. IMCC45533]
MRHLNLLLVAALIALPSVAQKEGKTKTGEIPDTAVKAKKDLKTPELSFNDYWYDGKAEISSYKLEQARYGEMRKGTLVNVFVTETFSPKANAKTDTSDKGNVKVLKHITDKNFNTGIYSYSILNSSFYPIDSKKYKSSLKVSTSLQEWCGHDYAELVNEGGKYNVSLHSYYEGEGFEDKELGEDVFLEDDIWSMIRVEPKKLITGKKVKMMPSFSYLRFLHKEIKGYDAVLSLNEKDGKITYEIDYPTLNRNLRITFEAKFPNRILSWEETCLEGSGAMRKLLTSKAKLIKTIKLDYWSKNTNKDLYLRKELGIE